MGFDTYLEIDGKVALQWRKYASSLPCLLFRPDQVDVAASTDEYGDTSISVRYLSNAEEVLTTLTASGLGWNATLAAYADIRSGSMAHGMLMGRGIAEGDDNEKIERAQNEFDRLPAEVDLRALGAVLAAQWSDPSLEEVSIFKDLTYDGQISNYFSQQLLDVFDSARKMDGINEFAAARTAETWMGLQTQAPLLAWPMLFSIFLEALPPQTEVVYDLSEDAEQEQVSSIEEGRAYANEYWASSAGGLTASAQQLGRLFGILASFNSSLGEAFWLADAADRLARLKLLNSDPADTSTKTRGDALEALVEALFRAEEPDLIVLEKNYRTSEEEIDLIVGNSLKDPFWTAQSSPLILVECKNWKEKPGVPELRVLESKIKDRGAVCRIGIYVSMSGFTSSFLERLKVFQETGGMIYAIDGQDLADLVSSKMRLSEWLRREGIMRSMGRRTRK